MSLSFWLWFVRILKQNIAFFFDIYDDFQLFLIFKINFLSSLVTHFNTISAWTSTQIVRVLSLQERIKIVEKFLRVCQLSFEKGNFMGFYGVLSGLNLLKELI